MKHLHFRALKENQRPILIFFIGVLIFLVILVMMTPNQTLNSNSQEGFQALAGWQNSGHFNCIITPDHNDISKFNASFLTWWTPGQYIFPFLIQSLLHVSMGKAVVILNLICTFLGLVGFYKVFTAYRLEREIVIISLTLILTSYTVLSRFISYQGGESLSFLFFPWITYGFTITKKPLMRAVLVIPFLILGFMVKSQMLIALIPLFFIIALADPIRGLVVGGKFPVNFKKELYAAAAIMVTVVFTVALLYRFFISKGDNAAQPSHVDFSVMYILKPLAAPLSAIANCSHQLFAIGTKHYAAAIVLFTACVAVVLYAFTKSNLNDRYNLIVFIYYLITANIFIFLFISGSGIDQNVRHFKFAAYLFFPVLLMAFRDAVPVNAMRLAVIAIICVSLVNHFRLNKTSFNNTYIAQNGFRLRADEFPASLNNYMLQMQSTGKQLFFSPFEARWATGCNNFICVDNQSMESYYGHEYPVWYVQEMEGNDITAICKNFPGYKLQYTRRFGKYLLVKLK